MRVCVVGCGAVGSLFAAHLAQLDDVEVWAYDLASDHVEAINERGLRRLDSAGIRSRDAPWRLSIAWRNARTPSPPSD